MYVIIKHRQKKTVFFSQSTRKELMMMFKRLIYFLESWLRRLSITSPFKQKLSNSYIKSTNFRNVDERGVKLKI